MGNSKKASPISTRESVISQSEKMRSLGKMACNIAHEVSNPLAVIEMNMSLLRELVAHDKLTPEMTINTSKRVSEVVEKIRSIVSGIKAIAHDESLEPFKPIELQSIINNTLAICSDTYKRSNVKLSIGGDIRTKIECRPSQISQILLNLLNNSLDAISTNQHPWIKIIINSDNSNTYIKVIDSGRGISKEIREKIMQPFFTTKKSEKGTGLGLSISSELMQLHKGSLYIDEQAAHTTFVLKFPKHSNNTDIS